MRAEDRIPPHDLEAERSVLGSMMLSPEAVADGLSRLRSTHFYRPSHGIVFSAIFALFERKEPVDMVTVSAELKRMDKLDVIGGKSYLADVADSVPVAAHIEHYAKIVMEKAMLRQLIDAGTDIVHEAFSDQKEADRVLEDSHQRIMKLLNEQVQDEFVMLKDILGPVIDNIESVYDNDDKILGISTGYPDLDKMTSGFQPSDLIILAARPAMGKTTLAMNFAVNAALQKKVPIAFFSLEMPKEQLALRLLSMESKINMARLRTASIGDQEWKALTQALGRLSETQIFIDDSPSLTPIELRAKCRRLMRDYPVGLVVVDYLQLMRSGQKRSESRFQEVSEIVRQTKACARELQLPIMALSQLSRDIEKRGDTLPKLSDLRESGEIEQTADLVMFIHREYYDGAPDKVSPTKLIIAKQRNGPTGDIELVFRKDVLRFEMSTNRPPVKAVPAGM